MLNSYNVHHCKQIEYHNTFYVVYSHTHIHDSITLYVFRQQTLYFCSPLTSSRVSLVTSACTGLHLAWVNTIHGLVQRHTRIHLNTMLECALWGVLLCVASENLVWDVIFVLGMFEMQVIGVFNGFAFERYSK